MMGGEALEFETLDLTGPIWVTRDVAESMRSWQEIMELEYRKALEMFDADWLLMSPPMSDDSSPDPRSSSES
jgi:hypothetical protein